MPPAKKSKTSHNANDDAKTSSPVSKPLEDVVALQREWTPNREGRFACGMKKVRSAASGSLRGGDWILNKDGQGATLSFCFEFEGGHYGLSVGHVAEMGDSIFCFAEDEMEENHVTRDGVAGSAGYSYPMFEIGTVVSKSAEIDSLVFEIHVSTTAIAIAPAMLLAAASGLGNQPIELPNPSRDPECPERDALLIGFGAQRRGAVGKVATQSETRNGQYSRVGNMAIVHQDDPSVALTDDGDCGTIFVGRDGTPFYFHHCARTLEPRYSYGFPLSQVMASHIQLGGDGVERAVEQQQLSIADSVRYSEHQVSGLKQFNTHIVSPPQAAQSNSLANFKVTIVAAPTKSKSDK